MRRFAVFPFLTPILTLILILIFMSSILLIIPLSSAQLIVKEVKMNPEIIFPGENVDCKLVIENVGNTAEKITSIIFYSNAVKPKSELKIGTIPPLSTYEFPFTFKAEKSGRYIVSVKISSENSSLYYYIPFNVEDKLPELILLNDKIVLGELNRIKVKIDTDINVYIEPLFNATPKTVYGNGGEFLFYPKKRIPLKFKIYFYNGRNYHEYIQTFNPRWEESKGVFIRIKSPENAYLFDAVPINIEITNLKNNTIFKISISSEDEGIQKLELAKLDSGESANLTTYYTPISPGIKVINLKIMYEDLAKYIESRKVVINVSKKPYLDLCSYEFEKGVISGEICNLGFTEAKNVIVSVGSVKSFIGTISPNDYETFELSLKNESVDKLGIEWMNKAGKSLKLEKEIPIREVKIEVKSSNTPIIISAVIAIIVVGIVFFILMRRF